jgi:hypothetical protein
VPETIGLKFSRKRKARAETVALSPSRFLGHHFFTAAGG